MVLEEAASAQEPSSDFIETVPSSDIDPYAGSSPTYIEGREPSYVQVSPGVFVNLNNLPHIFQWFGQPQHPKAVVEAIKGQCKAAQDMLQRPLRQEEADALAFHMAKAVRIGGFGSTIGMPLGAVQALRTRKDWRFPGWTPFKEGGRFSPDRFGPLRGQLARSCWHVARYTAYFTVGALVGQVFFSSYALSLSMAGRATDPRLKDFTQTLQQRMKDGHGLEAGRRPPDTSDGPRRDETYEMARQRRNAQEAYRSRQRPGQQSAKAVDDMSPTGGAFEQDFTGRADEGGLMDDGQIQEQQYRPSPETNTATAPEMNRVSSQSRSSGSNESSSKASGSAWDRLRQTAMSSSPSSSSSQRSSTSPSTSTRQRPSRESLPEGARNSQLESDSFSFSRRDEDRQLAKSEAQREFDARIEREREGRDFSERGGGDGRSSNW